MNISSFFTEARRKEAVRLWAVVGAFFTAAGAFIVSLQPALDRARSWQETIVIIGLALPPLFAAKPARKDVNSQATLERETAKAYASGQSATRAKVAEVKRQAAQKGVQTRLQNKAAKADALNEPQDGEPAATDGEVEPAVKPAKPKTVKRDQRKKKTTPKKK